MLGYLVSCYFHEDYDCEASSPLEVVESFAIKEIPEYSRLLLGDLELLCSQGISEGEARDLWIDKLDAYYDPDRDGISYLQWLSDIRDLLKNRY
jgi:CdiI immunity protein